MHHQEARHLCRLIVSIDDNSRCFCSRGQSNEVPAAEGQHYCVDENTERRNHYLDLAGIENYTSRFEGKHFDSSVV